MIVIGHGASHFSTTWSLGTPNPPSAEQTWLFVEEYEAARRKLFSKQERKTIAASAIYDIAYAARCEHALDPEDEGLKDSFREALPVHAKAYFPFGPTGKE